MRIGHASISENNNNGRDGKALAGDQTGKEVCIRSFYSKPWRTLLRCKDRDKAEIMAKACESICNNPNVGYDQLQRLTLHDELAKLNYDYNKLITQCECDCSSFMTVCAECAGIQIKYPSGNAPVTANMVKLFEATGEFEVITFGINKEENLLRGDILVGAPNTHTVMILDDGMPKHIKERRVLQYKTPLMTGTDVKFAQQLLLKAGYSLGKWGADGEYGKVTAKTIKLFQMDHHLQVDGKIGPQTWMALEKYN